MAHARRPGYWVCIRCGDASTDTLCTTCGSIVVPTDAVQRCEYIDSLVHARAAGDRALCGATTRVFAERRTSRLTCPGCLAELVAKALADMQARYSHAVASTARTHSKRLLRVVSAEAGGAAVNERYKQRYRRFCKQVGDLVLRRRPRREPVTNYLLETSQRLRPSFPELTLEELVAEAVESAGREREPARSAPSGRNTTRRM